MNLGWLCLILIAAWWFAFWFGLVCGLNWFYCVDGFVDCFVLVIVVWFKFVWWLGVLVVLGLWFYSGWVLIWICGFIMFVSWVVCSWFCFDCCLRCCLFGLSFVCCVWVVVWLTCLVCVGLVFCFLGFVLMVGCLGWLFTYDVCLILLILLLFE